MTVDSAARVPLDIRSLPSTSPLARDYAFDFDRLSPFFNGNPADQNVWRHTINTVTAHAAHAQAPRHALATVLRKQLDRRHAPDAAFAAVARLEQVGSVAVVTGQQAGLFGGPLYTLLKAVSAITLAAQVEAVHGIPAVPVFWVDAEDHDWNEVRTCTVMTGDDTVATISAGDLPGAGVCPVAKLVLDASIEDTLAALEQALPSTPFTPGLMADLRRAYRPGVHFTEAFASLIESLLGSLGLVVFESNDPAAKPLVASLLEAEVHSAPRTSQLAAEAGRSLSALGYHAQVEPSEDAAALFELGLARRPVTISGELCQIGGDEITRTIMAERVRHHPESVGPNVLLRPLVQDSLFPTACYVAGPSELAYLAQLRSVYHAHGLPMPLVCTRASGTFLDSNGRRFLDRHALEVSALQPQNEGVLNSLLASQMPTSVDSTWYAATEAVTSRMTALAAAVPAVDATLEGAVKSAAGRMHDDLKKIQFKILQAAKKKDVTLRRQFRHAQVQAFPNGMPQERLLGFVSFLNRVGPGLMDRVVADMPPTSGRHWLVTL